MHRSFRSPASLSSPVRTLPRPHQRKSHRHVSGDGGANNMPDRVRCSICGAYNNINTVPGANFPTVYQVTGTRYVWDAPTDPITSLDKTVTPVPAVNQACWHCGGTAFLSGSRGSGQ